MDYTYILDKIPVRKTASQYVQLINDGSFWRGNCPLCGDTEQNLIIITNKKAFYCCSCREDGTIIDFVAKVEKSSVAQAAQQLINQWGIPQSS